MRDCPAKRGHHTDCVGGADACNIQIPFEKYLGNEFFGAYTSRVAMTSVGGEIAAMTGDFMNPYPDGKLGVIEEGHMQTSYCSMATRWKTTRLLVQGTSGSERTRGRRGLRAFA
jgi:hypothetical protein